AEEMSDAVFNAVIAHLKTERDANIRQRLLYSLNYITDKTVAPKVRALILTEGLRVNEVPFMISGLTMQKENVAAGWAWSTANFEPLVQRTPRGGRDRLVNVGGAFCSQGERNDYTAFFDKRVNDLEGAQRNYASVLEDIGPCIVLKNAQQPK